MGCLLVMCLIYSMSLVCAEIIVKNTDTYVENGLDVEEYFGTLPRCWFTLFNMIILDEWADILRPMKETSPVMVLPFICFSSVISFALMNVIIGVICTQTDEAIERYKSVQLDVKRGSRLRLVHQLATAIIDADVDGDGLVSPEEFECQEVKDTFSALELPKDFHSNELHVMADTDGDGKVTVYEFL